MRCLLPPAIMRRPVPRPRVRLPFEVMLLSMLIEQQKHVVTLGQKVMTLENWMSYDSTQGMAS